MRSIKGWKADLGNLRTGKGVPKYLMGKSTSCHGKMPVAMVIWSSEHRI
jgi:hypothetical protein